MVRPPKGHLHREGPPLDRALQQPGGLGYGYGVRQTSMGIMVVTDKQKAILVRFFLASRKLNRAKGDKTAKEYAETMANCIVELGKGETDFMAGLIQLVMKEES